MYRPEDYQYKVGWSEEDQAYVGRVAEFPALAGHGDSEAKAMEEIQTVLGAVLEDLVKRSEEIPAPRKPFCRLCENKPEPAQTRLDLNSGKPWRWWCAACRKWFDKNLERIKPEHSEAAQ